MKPHAQYASHSNPEHIVSEKEREAAKRLEAIINAETDDFAELLSIAGLDSQHDLEGTDLASLDLSRADLSGANLRSASLEGAVLSNAKMTEVDFEGADLSRASLRDAAARGANFTKAKAVRADFSGASLQNAKFVETDLSEAIFRGATLRDAHFEVCTVNGADFVGTDIHVTIRRNTDFSKAKLGTFASYSISPLAETTFYMQDRLNELAYFIWESSGRQTDITLDSWLAATKYVQSMMAVLKRAGRLTMVDEESLAALAGHGAEYFKRVRQLAEMMWESGGRLYGNTFEVWLSAEKHVWALMAATIATTGSTAEAGNALAEALCEFSPGAYLENIQKTAYHIWEVERGSAFENWLAAESYVVAILAGSIRATGSAAVEQQAFPNIFEIYSGVYAEKLREAASNMWKWANTIYTRPVARWFAEQENFLKLMENTSPSLAHAS